MLQGHFYRRIMICVDSEGDGLYRRKVDACEVERDKTPTDKNEVPHCRFLIEGGVVDYIESFRKEYGRFPEMENIELLLSYHRSKTLVAGKIHSYHDTDFVFDGHSQKIMVVTFPYYKNPSIRGIPPIQDIPYGEKILIPKKPHIDRFELLDIR